MLVRVLRLMLVRLALSLVTPLSLLVPPRRETPAAPDAPGSLSE